MLGSIKKGDRRPLYQVLFNLAESYNKISIHSYDQIAASKDPTFAAPGIMCQCFSIELLLKFFLVFNHPEIYNKADADKLGIKLKGHKYSELFDRLSQESKTSVALTYSHIASRDTSAEELKNLLIEIGDEPFVTWRYIYEDDGIRHLNVVLLNQISDAFGKTAANEVQKLKRNAP